MIDWLDVVIENSMRTAGNIIFQIIIFQLAMLFAGAVKAENANEYKTEINTASFFSKRNAAGIFTFVIMLAGCQIITGYGMISLWLCVLDAAAVFFYDGFCMESDA